ncbi:hypothetical protein CFU_1186 [Collimonas fungivorans Ter331]|uniref:Uncharacterized protein n=1 Tax=Collimonas fungivorans (strain Ter331) TaxID=1005048 RepID=G0AJ84_COLFT|nr:hypothetical protein CFU_1186 [Collimonas fungivorans Ter331]
MFQINERRQRGSVVAGLAVGNRADPDRVRRQTAKPQKHAWREIKPSWLRDLAACNKQVWPGRKPGRLQLLGCVRSVAVTTAMAAEAMLLHLLEMVVKYLLLDWRQHGVELFDRSGAFGQACFSVFQEFHPVIEALRGGLLGPFFLVRTLRHIGRPHRLDLADEGLPCSFLGRSDFQVVMQLGLAFCHLFGKFGLLLWRRNVAAWAAGIGLGVGGHAHGSKTQCGHADQQLFAKLEHNEILP